MANWSDLPVDILCLFVERLPPSVEETVRFAAVCRSWKCAATHVNKTRHRLSVWMMLAESRNNDPVDPQGATRRCYSLSTDKMFNLQLPELQGRRCWGTKHGLLVAYGGLELDLFLFNPLTRDKIMLPSPPLSVIPQQISYMRKTHVILGHAVKFAFSWDSPDLRPGIMMLVNPSCNYASPDYSGCQLCLASPDYSCWKLIKTPPTRLVDDVLFVRNHFYCITQCGELWICGSSETEYVAPPPAYPEFMGGCKCHLVEISGNLYLLNRIYDSAAAKALEEEMVRLYGPELCMDPQKIREYHLVTGSFSAFKLDLPQKKWSCCVRHLEGYAVFVGDNAGFAISTSEYPQFKSDYIYFTDDDYECFRSSYSDMGIYDYKERAIVGSFDSCVHKPSEFSRSVFFTPLQANLP